MPDFKDLLKSDEIISVAVSSIKIGDVFYLGMDETNGIIPKDGQRFRNKYFVVLGFDNSGRVYGGIVANTDVNVNIPEERQRLHVKIKQSQNPFLMYDSYLDCSKLKEVHISKLDGFPYKGKLHEDDLKNAIENVKRSRYITKNDLKRFGIG